MLILLIFCILLLILLLQSYCFYPLSLLILGTLRKRNYKEEDNFRPGVSVLISAYNEEKVIADTIGALIDSDYDVSKIEIIIGSDNSTDNTNNIVMQLKKQNSNIKLIEFSKRRGKPNVINDLVQYASFDLLVFCDANTNYDKNAIRNLVRPFADERIGGVCGKLRLLNKQSGFTETKEKTYWEIETWIKELEGKLGMVIGANGGIYCIRKELFEKLPTNSPVMDDFYISLKVLEKKRLFAFASDAVAMELNPPTIKIEFKRKQRNNSINLFTIRYIKKLLNPFYGLVSYCLWSHKIIRWFTPILLLLVFILNLFLLNEPFFFLCFILQLLLIFASLLGWIFSYLKIRFNPFAYFYYFTMTNIAMFIGIYKFLFKKQQAFWQSTPR